MKKWMCTVCGYIHAGENPPDECPVCGADSSKFEEIVEATSEEQKRDLPVVKETGVFDKLVDLMLQNHFHPITVHTPNGIVPAAVLFLFLAIGLKMQSFEVPAFYNMVFVLIAMPAVLFSGYIEWQKHYNGAKTTVFFTKITCGITVLVLILILVVWRASNPDIAGSDSSGRWIYFLLHLVVLGAVGIAGNLGGKLVFNRKK